MSRLQRIPIFVLAACALLSFLFLAYPLFVIRPFRHQGPAELAVALTVLRIRPFCQIALALLAAWFGVRVWRKDAGLLQRIISLFLALITIGCAVLSRINVYEIMFHPLARPVFVAGAASKLDRNEQVIAVSVNQHARAYPIRVISYHHIVNDTLGGVPIVATY